MGGVWARCVLSLLRGPLARSEGCLALCLRIPSGLLSPLGAGPEYTPVTGRGNDLWIVGMINANSDSFSLAFGGGGRRTVAGEIPTGRASGIRGGDLR